MHESENGGRPRPCLWNHSDAHETCSFQGLRDQPIVHPEEVQAATFTAPLHKAALIMAEQWFAGRHSQAKLPGRGD